MRTSRQSRTRKLASSGRKLIAILSLLPGQLTDRICPRSEQEAKKEAEELARAQRIADGKERKRGRNELDDDDFDDDYVRGGRGEKRERVEQETVADLRELAETELIVCVRIVTNSWKLRSQERRDSTLRRNTRQGVRARVARFAMALSGTSRRRRR